MDNITIPASITIEKSFSTQKYKWKSDNKKESLYRRPNKRAVIRFTCKNFANKINKLERDKRQIEIFFQDDSNVIIKKIGKSGISLQGYAGKHPYAQIVINRCLPKKIWEKFEKSNKKTLTFPVNVSIDLNDWKNLKISPEDFILEIEKEAKSLMNKSLKKGFKIDIVSKGRIFDLRLISPNNKEFAIAISSHIAKTKSRSKEKTIQKILMDIAKMLPYLYENKSVNPVIITRPIEFENSWSYTTQKYLDFYNKKFGFTFITTEFKNGWEDSIIERLLRI